MPELSDRQLERMDARIARILYLAGWEPFRDFGLFVLEKDGKPCELPIRSFRNRPAKQQQVIFSGLAPGQYILSVRSTKEVIETGRLPGIHSNDESVDWKRAELKFAITAKSPPVIQVSSLNLEWED
jgi:hypothetical protein